MGLAEWIIDDACLVMFCGTFINWLIASLYYILSTNLISVTNACRVFRNGYNMALTTIDEDSLYQLICNYKMPN